MSELPIGWMPGVSIKDVCTTQAGYGFPVELQGRMDGEFGFYKVGDISRNWQAGRVILIEAEHYITAEDVVALGAKPLPGGTVVFAKIGAAVALNRRAILTAPSLIDNNAMGLVPSDATLSKFVFYFMCQIDLGARTRGGNVPSLRKGDVEEIAFPLPPLAEQRRIVAKIEELFSELDQGIENLKQARAQLAVYRQSLLKHAFEGKLTAAWRAMHAAQIETPRQLLERLRAERRKSWTGKGKYQEPADPEVDGLPEIPADWKWARLDLIGMVEGGMSVSKDRQLDVPMDVPYLRVANVQRGRLNLETMKTMKIEARDLNGLRLKKGDILFNEGGDRDKLGRGWVWEGQIDPCITQNHVFRVSPLFTDSISSEFVSHWGNTFGQQFFLDHGKQTTNLASINKAVLSRLPVPLPSPEEQREITAQIEIHSSAIDRTEADIEINLQKAEALRQSILKKAFSGELVPQDPADEPASALLARLRAERAQEAGAPKEPRVTKRKSALSA